MFKDAIRNTPLNTEYANRFFEKNIIGDEYDGDYSFVTSLRALVYPRMKDDDVLDFYYRETFSPYMDCPAGNAANFVVKNTYTDIYKPGITIVHKLCGGDKQQKDIWMSAIRETFEDNYRGWHYLEKVTLFFKKQFQVLCFINPDTKGVYIFTDSMDMRKMHYLQCGIFAFYPWYFDPKEGVSEDEMALINSLREKTSDKYVECIAKIAEKYNFKEARIRELLNGFETQHERLQMSSLRSRIVQIISNINIYNDKIITFMKEKNDAESQLLGLQTKIDNDSGDSEIMDYFLCNQKLVLESVAGDEMVFGVRDYLSYFNEDMAKTFIDNKNSYLYKHKDSICDSDIEMLMNAIFIEQTVRVRMCAQYRLVIPGGAYAISGATYGSEYANCLPNPHIDEYACLGAYLQTINQLLQEHNYIGAIEQCVASCKSLNVGEAPTMEKFVNKIYASNARFIELPDGKLASPKEAIAYLKQQQEGTDNG